MSIKTASIAVGLQSEELRYSHGSCLAHEILIVMGLVGVVATTQLVPFFLCVRHRVYCGFLLILWQHGDLQDIVVSTTLSYGGVTDIVQIAVNPVLLV